MSKELTIAEKLRDLYELQNIDSELHEISIIKGALPMEVEDLEDEIEGLKTRSNRIQGSIDELDERISQHEANIKEANALKAKYTKQMDTVKNNREFGALTKELELQSLEIQLSEKKIRESKHYKIKKEETLKNTLERLEKKEADLKTKKVELEKIIEKTDKQEGKLNRKKKRAEKNIDEKLIRAYRKIIKTYRNGLAVVTVERDSCGGCHNAVPPQIQLEISMYKKIMVCENCGRILVNEEIRNIGKEDVAKAGK